MNLSIPDKAPAFINIVRRNFKAPTFLIDTLYYNINHVEQLDFIPHVKNNAYSGITVTHLTDALSNTDPSSMLTFLGYRIPLTNELSLIEHPQYNETITLRNAAGTLTATATYSDAGLTFETSTAAETYPVLNGTGRYADAKFVVIFFNNDNKTRVVKIFAYLKKI